MSQETQQKATTSSPSSPPQTPSAPTFTFELEDIKLSAIKNLDINPRKRIEAERVKDLSSDKIIQSGKLVDPLKVIVRDGEYVLFDGHRRKAALAGLGKVEVEVRCLVYSISSSGKNDLATLYASMNTLKKHNGGEKAAIFRSDSAFLTEKEQLAFEDAFEKLGEDDFDKCVEAGIDPRRNSKQLATVHVRTGKSMDKVKEWFFSGDKPRTKSLRDFQSEWNNVPKEDKDNDDANRRVMARACMSYAIENEKSFDTSDYVSIADGEDAA